MATQSTVRELGPAEVSTPPPLSVEQYLRSSIRPDCDFVDGQVEERNVGEFEHAWLQKALMRIFLPQEEQWGVSLVQECRLQISESRFRVPDSMILKRGKTYRGVLHEAPLVCIEVLSPEDSWMKLRERLDDYLAIGVEHVWCFEPEAREARRYTANGFDRVTEPELIVPGTSIRVNIAAVFSILDEN
jgi:Uma2 family endonuclease